MNYKGTEQINWPGGSVTIPHPLKMLYARINGVVSYLSLMNNNVVYQVPTGKKFVGLLFVVTTYNGTNTFNVHSTTVADAADGGLTKFIILTVAYPYHMPSYHYVTGLEWTAGTYLTSRASAVNIVREITVYGYEAPA